MTFFGVYEEYFQIWMPQLAHAGVMTLQLAVLSMTLSLAYGLVIALARGSRVALLRAAAVSYVETVRGIPTLALLFLIYFGFPALEIRITAFWATVVALGMNGAAYMSEIYRAGIEAVDRGQTEAALAIGMSRSSVMRFIVLPQAIRIVLPPTTNLAIDVLKDTALASIIATPELMSRALDLVSQYYRPMHIYLLCAILYLLVTFPMVQVVRALEAHVGRGRRRLTTL
jgi:His/Glu/Gln/Arg/opine family amino acid ABC transporter permease subunit